MRLPEPGAVQVHPEATVPGRPDHRDQLVPAGQDETGVPQRQLQQQRADRLVEPATSSAVGLRGASVVRTARRPPSTRVRVPLVHQRVAERVQADGVPAGQLRAVPHGDLLGHRAGGEEGDRLGAQQLGDPALHRLDRPPSP